MNSIEADTISKTIIKIKNIKSSCCFCASIDNIISEAESKGLSDKDILKLISNYNGMLCGAAEDKKYTAMKALVRFK